MLKKILGLVLVGAMTLSLCACGGSGSGGGNIKSFEEAKGATQYDKSEWSGLNQKNVDIVKFGMYPQSDVTGNKKEPIYWNVVFNDTENRIITLISQDILDVGSYEDSLKNKTFYYGQTKMGNFLNKTFYNEAFSDEEKNMIQADRENNKVACYPNARASLFEKCTELMKAKPTKYAQREMDGVQFGGKAIKYSIVMEDGYGMYWFDKCGVNVGDSISITVCFPDGTTSQRNQDLPNVGIRPSIQVKY